MVRMLDSLKSIINSRKKLSIAVIIIIAAALPLTVFIAQKQQEIRQRASGEQTTLFFSSGNGCSSPISNTTFTFTPGQNIISLCLNTNGNTVNAFDVVVSSGNATTFTDIAEGTDAANMFNTLVFKTIITTSVRLSKVDSDESINTGNLFLAKITLNAGSSGNGNISLSKALINSVTSPTGILTVAKPTLNYTITSAGNGTITGYVYSDVGDGVTSGLAGNGQKDPGELGVGNVTVNLSGQSTASTTTGSDGSYTFSGLALGTFTVGVTMPTNFVKSPGDTASKQVTPSPNGTANFGLSPSKNPPCYIIDPKATQLGITSGTRGYGDVVGTSGSDAAGDGKVSLYDALYVLRYVAAIPPVLNPIQMETANVRGLTTPANAVDALFILRYLAGLPIAGAAPDSFPVCPAISYTIQGSYFVDNNNNQIRDCSGTCDGGAGDEPQYSGATVERDGGENPIPTTTNSSNPYNYSFINLEASAYTITAYRPIGYTFTTPNTCSKSLPPNAICNFGIIPNTTPTTAPSSCAVTTSPGAVNLTIGGVGNWISANVTSGLGSATITRMRFGSNDTSIATVNPASDTTSEYRTIVTAVANGSTAVWATADLSDGRTCESASTTDTDITVSAPTPTPTAAPIPNCNGGGSCLACVSDQSNTCDGRGKQSCTYTLYNGDPRCNTVTSQVQCNIAPPNCLSGYTCNANKVCVVNPTVTPTLTPIPTQGVTPGVTNVATGTPTPQTGNTILKLNIGLEGIWKVGDHTNPDPTDSTKNPQHTSRPVTVEIYNGSEVLASTFTGTINYIPGEGIFQGAIDLGQTPSGNYIVKVKSLGYLKRRLVGITSLVKGDVYNAAQINLVVGDLNSDNHINIVDYNILDDCIFHPSNPSNPAIKGACGQNPDYPIISDLNDDGIKNILDYSLLVRELQVTDGD